ncbi:hypothetical protein COCVIDRAFT_105151 [Bipolaris victoriae FI3]|uniref:Uncharacterized protein n=2 Tax=Bipolaris TaxID=33194 RepID=W6XYE4_COCC2|nr:uncharacterized protein COCCADRAFT_98609 [Bipolaris zeicola 26-R-13]XP_014554368.1 hypothetical protein COCVIDRAFT_105151 [Bipolaris victoriae FI3]EUC32482.1 hypothetical protein COCCADRAFT_98609 [Bipolaris zeicola 26-R-13]
MENIFSKTNVNSTTATTTTTTTTTLTTPIYSKQASLKTTCSTRSRPEFLCHKISGREIHTSYPHFN